MMKYKSMGKLQGRRNRGRAGGALPSPTKMEMLQTVSEMKTFLTKLKVVTKYKFFRKMFCLLEQNVNDVLGLDLKIITVRGNFFDLAVGPMMR